MPGLTEIVYRPDRAEGAQRLVSTAKAFAAHNRLTVDVEQGPCCLEVTLNGMGGSYSRSFLQEFTHLLQLADRFRVYSSRGRANEVLFTLEYDTHDYYVAGKKLNEGW